MTKYFPLSGCLKCVWVCFTGDANTDGEKNLHIDPVLNLGGSLNQLYFPKKERQKRRVKKRDKDEKVTAGVCGYASDPGRLGYDSDPGSRLCYDSDPGAKMGLCEIISNVPEIQTAHSSSDVSQTSDVHNQVDEVFVVNSSKSLPNTPRVSPKLIRRNSKSDLHVDIPQGPGFSFLAGVAGELHLRKLQHDKKLETGLAKVSPGYIVSSAPVSAGHNVSSAPVSAGHIVCSAPVSAGQIVGSPPADVATVSSPPADVATVVSQSRVEATVPVSLYSDPSTVTHTHHMHDFSDSTGADLESHTPKLVKSFFQWGTKTKVQVTSKESNMFSPTSF